MTDEYILMVVLREMVAYGRAWRADWSSFDGRYLRDQLDHLEDWAIRAKAGTLPSTNNNYTAGTEFYQEHTEGIY